MQSSASDSQQPEQQINQRPSPLPPQRWMAMQYPHAAAMVMQHHHPQMVPPMQNYVAYAQYQAPPQQRVQQGSGGGGAGEENRSIWIGDLHHLMDENYLRSCFNPTEIASVKIIRNKQTGESEGYGFVEFFSHDTAEKVIQTYPSMLMPNTEHPFRLNWAAFSTNGDKRSTSSDNNGSDLSIFVGDLAADVTDTLLHDTFATKYNSVKAAKIVFDVNTGRSKGYGFVRFGDDSERSKAMTEMNGVYCSSRAMRIGAATPRKSSSGYQQQHYHHPSQSDGDSTNTTIFVGGLDQDVADEDLRRTFSQYGEIVSVKIPFGKNCGFVQFANRNNAEEALQNLNGETIGKQTVRLSWGRNPANKQFRGGDSRNQWGGAVYYGGGQAYEGYGYGMAPAWDPSMYVAAYGSYPVVYGSHQQQVS